MATVNAHSNQTDRTFAHRARKRFGQNFLVDKTYIRRIVEVIDPKPGEHIVEIGPGQAALTRELLDAMQSQCAADETASLDVVEIDRDLVARLKTEFTEQQLRIHEGDALEFDFATLPSPIRVIGNLPYNISTPILFRLCEYEDRIADMTFMLQKEVVDRMAAGAGEDARGRLSVMLQYRYRVEKCFDVPPGAFRPIPAVDSSIVRLAPLAMDSQAPVGAQRLRPKNEKFFAQLVTQAFTQRRKMLRKSLVQWINAERFEKAGVNPQARAEDLTTAQFVALADSV